MGDKMSPKRPVRWIAVILGFAFLLAVARTFRSSEEPLQGRQKVSLRLAWIPGPTFAGDYVAAMNGYWNEEQLEVDVQPGGFAMDALKLVAAGANTFGVASGPQLILARANGVPVVAIGSTIPTSPIGWVAKRESGIREPKDFVGRRVGAQFGTHTEITFEAMLRNLNIDIGAVTRVPVQFDLKPFVSGDVDVLPVYLIDQPVDLEGAGIQLNRIDPRDYGVAFMYGNVYFTTENMAKSHPEIVRRFLRGAVRGWKAAASDRSGAIAALEPHMGGYSRALLRTKIDATLDYVGARSDTFPGVFKMDKPAWDVNIQLLRAGGALSTDVKAEECYDDSFLGK